MPRTVSATGDVMNKWVRLAFMPVMIVAGVFTSFMCAAIIAPIALWERFDGTRHIKEDLKAFRARREQRRNGYARPGQ